MKKRFISFLPVFLLLASMLAFSPDVLACSCYPAPAVDAEFAESTNVIVARLDGFEELSREVSGARVFPYHSVSFTVERVFKGGLKSAEVIKVVDGADEGTCMMGFLRRSVGDKFLFFMGGPGGAGSYAPSLYRVGLCGRSKLLERAQGDIEFLENRSARIGQSRLSGTIRAAGENTPLPSVAGLKVDVDGPVRRSGVTGEHGFFELWDLPAGEYTVSFGLPDGWKIVRYSLVPAADRFASSRRPDGSPIRAAIEKGVHTEINVLLSIDNQISGTVQDKKGRPVKDVCVSAYWVTPTSTSFSIPENCTDEQGRFLIKELPPGKYRLEITPNKHKRKPDDRKTFYYPGVRDKELAEPVSVDAGKSVNGLTIQLMD